MTQEEKLKEAKRLYKTANADQKYVLESLFPELKESEDERIRKELLNAFQESEDSIYMVLTPHRRESFIAWLEKQGEHAKFRDSIQVGDKVTRNEDGVLVNLSQLNRVAKKDEKQGKKTKPIEGFNTEFERQVSCLIASAINKDYEYTKDFVKWTSEGLLNYAKLEIEKNSMGISEATKKKLEDNLNKALEKETPESWNKFLDEQGEQKPAWSEEDEDILNTIINHFKVDIECTDEDDIIKWLKSLKERYTWKPSEEQIIELRRVISGCSYDIEPLAEMEEQLKKLREE